MFDRLATRTANAVGTAIALYVFVLLVLLWLATGPFLGFSSSWQLLINTPTTIVTTGLVILLQYTSNRDTTAIHTKLDVLIEASSASNNFAAIEQMDAQQLGTLHDRVIAEMEERGDDDQ